MATETETDYDDGDPYACIAYGYWQSKQRGQQTTREEGLEAEIKRYYGWGAKIREPELVALLDREVDLSRRALENLQTNSEPEDPVLARWAQDVLHELRKRYPDRLSD